MTKSGWEPIKFIVIFIMLYIIYMLYIYINIIIHIYAKVNKLQLQLNFETQEV